RMSQLVTDCGRDAGMDSIIHEVQRCLSDAGIKLSDIRGVGVAAPGTMDPAAGVILHPFNLAGWENLPLRQIVADRLRAPVVLLNDANAAAYGEFWVGAGREYRSLMLWTLGTGIGGGIVLDGEVLVGAHAHAAECGHMVIQCDDGPRSDHGIHGSVELFSGARALLRRCREALNSDRNSLLRDLDANATITPTQIAAAAEEGDDLALELILETARYLAIGTVNIMHIVNPEIVLFGGAMTFGQDHSPVGRRFMDEIRSRVKVMAFPIPAAQTRIEYASLGNDAGFIGAAGCALRASQSGPLS
ncbi:MAG: ROK family protein, partial [Planctomycetaceae bacterium]|nr:ROK family protein [Planctomycetaceae bacterium]